jgi:CheY-like chemotaxis protein/anti-sigma regulatory factor (Ser/Thr protein kinase)
VTARSDKPSRILVVDDDRATRLLLRKQLEAAGFEVSVAGDGLEALKLLRTRKLDLIVLDIWMPKMTGLDLLARLKRRKSRPKAVVMTSDDTPATLLQAVREQAFEYVQKPVEPSALLQLVRAVLKGEHEPPPIEVVSARPEWVELLAPCTREAAARVESVVAHLDTDLAKDVRESIGFAFRELLLNAVEWGGKLDPDRKVRVAYVRARRMVLYRIADPGSGFRLDDLPHAAISYPDDPIQHMNVREAKGIRPGGFGLLMVQAKVDELIYNEKRNDVIFIKYLD